MGLLHTDCGGVVVEDWSVVYECEGGEVPAYRCVVCGKEILGDPECYLDPPVD